MGYWYRGNEVIVGLVAAAGLSLSSAACVNRAQIRESTSVSETVLRSYDRPEPPAAERRVHIEAPGTLTPQSEIFIEARDIRLCGPMRFKVVERVDVTTRTATDMPYGGAGALWLEGVFGGIGLGAVGTGLGLGLGTTRFSFSSGSGSKTSVTVVTLGGVVAVAFFAALAIDGYHLRTSREPFPQETRLDSSLRKPCSDKPVKGQVVEVLSHGVTVFRTETGEDGRVAVRPSDLKDTWCDGDYEIRVGAYAHSRLALPGALCTAFKDELKRAEAERKEVIARRFSDCMNRCAERLDQSACDSLDSDNPTARKDCADAVQKALEDRAARSLANCIDRYVDKPSERLVCDLSRPPESSVTDGDFVVRRASCSKTCVEEGKKRRAERAGLAATAAREAARTKREPRGKTCHLWTNVGSGLVQGTICCSFKFFTVATDGGECPCSQAPNYCR